MIRRIEARNYRLLKSIDQSLQSFHILIGANAVGKSTFFDVLAFLGDFINWGAKYAISQRTTDFRELTHQMEGGVIFFAVDVNLADISDGQKFAADFIRYEVEFSEESAEKIKSEKVSLHYEQAGGGYRNIAKRIFNENKPYIQLENERSGEPNDEDTSPTNPEFVPLRKNDLSILSLIINPATHPASFVLIDQLQSNTGRVLLNSAKIATPLYENQHDDSFLEETGSNFALLLKRLWDKRLGDIDINEQSDSYQEWIRHIQLVLPEIDEVRPIEKGDGSLSFDVRFSWSNQEDNYLSAESLSDGTRRLLALTILPYIQNSSFTYLIEEPENGVHPQGLEAVYKALASIYYGQILVSTHSPLLLAIASRKDVLAFSKKDDASVIIKGDEHPELKNWSETADFATLFASGVLG